LPAFRQFSTQAPSAPGSGDGNAGSTGGDGLSRDETLAFVADLDKRRRAKAVWDSVTIDPRVRMPFDEFIALCATHSIERKDAIDLAENLTRTGLVWYFKESVPLIIKPDQVARQFLRSVDLDSAVNREWLNTKHTELIALLEEIEPLQKQYDEIQAKAERYATNVWRAGFTYVTAHCMIVPYLTFWRLSWDIMEPVTYMFNLWTLFFGIWFYRKTHFEFTYESINDAVLRLRKELYFTRAKFDIERYETLREKIAECEDDLMNPEWEALKAVHPGVPDAVRMVHLSPLELLEKHRAGEILYNTRS
jgi:hypothetical protein